ncbi:hypothetical protein CAL12_19365 [Bordetella genomosp. 8]|uniref:Uncharacterized protein n=1 Tax=Bordetella genomosp. 8 TaxID=1416806 RepID=A0A1W6YP09_9BORD|nr:hypothetical protein [Bordetella genomosp. 8]ARP82761.1 hypothetical protein CAL12_19365 [Bordetella genomosp. 8]
MSDNATAVAAISSAPVERAGVWRGFRAFFAAPFVALWESWSTPDTSLKLHQLTEAELLDMGASPDELAEAQALREFEQHRAYAMSLYYW